MAIEIVALQPEYVQALAELEQLCFSDPWTASQLAEEMDNPLAVDRVALNNGRVAGYAGMHYVLDEASITNIAVFPEFRRCGVAQQLLSALDRFCRTHRMASLTLEVRVSNQPAIALYQKMGFSSVGCRKNFYSYPAEDALLMTRYFEPCEWNVQQATDNLSDR